jgi:sRNA-binding regulator protein Hfq
MLPLNILSYLSYLRRMRMKVPVWLINHIKMLEQNHYKNTKRQ